LKGLEKPQPPPQRCSAQEKEAYRNALAEVAKKVMSEGRNTLRMSLVKSQYGALEAAYQAELERKRQPPPKPKKGKAAVSRTAAGGTRPGPMDKFVRCLAGATGAASSASASSSSVASSSSSAASSPPSSGGAGAFTAAAAVAAAAAGAAAVAAAASAPFTPTKAPRPALRTPSAPKKGKRPMLLTSDGEDEEDDEGLFGGSGVRDLNMLFSKRPRLGASDDEGEGESSIVDLCTSLSSIAEETGGGGRAEAVVEAAVEVEVEIDDEVEIVEEEFSLARVGSPRAARGRRRRDRCRTPGGMETVDLTKS
jgi:hypothetical protein